MQSEKENPKGMVETKLFLNADELSEMIGVRRDTIYRWVSQKRIPCVKLGRKTLFRPEKIKEWIQQNSIEFKDFS